MKSYLKKAGVAVATALMIGSSAIAGPAEVDPKLPDYTPVSGVSGTLKSVGSDTLNNMMTLWGEAFRKHYPHVKIEIEGKGSSTAPPALIAGTSNLGPMSRQMKQTEIDAFEAKHGYKPVAVGTSIDALAVFVNKDNPIKGLNLQQVDSIFSKTFNQGGQNATKWGDVGLTGEWANKPFSIYGRNSASGTYGFFKKVALSKGDYKDTVKEQPGSSAVVQGVGEELGGIGYSGIGYATADVRAVPLAKSGNSYAEPTAENCINGSYPLARVLFVYVNKKPNEKVDTLTYEFLRFVLSKQGQEVVVKDGYYPLTAAAADSFLDSIK